MTYVFRFSTYITSGMICRILFPKRYELNVSFYGLRWAVDPSRRDHAGHLIEVGTRVIQIAAVIYSAVFPRESITYQKPPYISTYLTTSPTQLNPIYLSTHQPNQTKPNQITNERSNPRYLKTPLLNRTVHRSSLYNIYLPHNFSYKHPLALLKP